MASEKGQNRDRALLHLRRHLGPELGVAEPVESVLRHPGRRLRVAMGPELLRDREHHLAVSGRPVGRLRESLSHGPFTLLDPSGGRQRLCLTLAIPDRTVEAAMLRPQAAQDGELLVVPAQSVVGPGRLE